MPDSAKARVHPDLPALERAAFAAWPAAEVADLDGWKLRFTSGVSRRANSAWTFQDHGSLDRARRIQLTEEFYAKRAQPPLFQVTTLEGSEALDAELAERGYDIDAPVAVLATDIAAIATLDSQGVTRVENEPFADWLEISGRRGRFADVLDTYTALLRRMVPRAAFALGETGGVPAGVGLAVLDCEYCGISSMHTLPEFRRLGVARAVLVALARQAQARGAQTMFLQVERDNLVALELYTRLGFRELYGYHYRIRSRSRANR